MEEQIKIAFSKVKEDILNLKSEISEIKELIKSLYDELNTQKLRELSGSTIQQINPTDSFNPADNPTVRQEVGGLKSQNLDISIGNKGVPTDRQTIQQTDNLTQNYIKSVDLDIKKASEIMDSLDSVKKQILLKFKRITNQEMVVFSSIYQLEDQGINDITYSKIASILCLSESSIRDYVQRIVSKGIPIKKQKINNKKIILSISQELKKIASLDTLIRLREL